MHIDSTIYVWKQNAHIEDNDKDTMLLVRSGNISDEKKNCLEKINLDDMVQWLLEYFQTWDIEKKGEYKYDFNYNGELDYAIYKYVLFAMKNEYMISLSYTNLSETELNDILLTILNVLFSNRTFFFCTLLRGKES